MAAAAAALAQATPITMAPVGGADGGGRRAEAGEERLSMPSRNPLPLSASQEAQVREVFNARVRAHCADDIKGKEGSSASGLAISLPLSLSPPLSPSPPLSLCPCPCLSVVHITLLHFQSRKPFIPTTPEPKLSTRSFISLIEAPPQQPSQTAPAAAPSASRSRAGPSRTP